MTEPITRQLVEDFYRVRLSRDRARIAPFLADDVDWLTSGPVELLNFCGQRHGKEAVLDTIVRLVPSLLHVTKVELEALLVDGERASTFGRVTAVQIASGRTISYRQAQFLHFRDHKIVWYRGILDSFDVAEQMIGHSIMLSPPAKHGQHAGHLVEV